MDNKKTLKTIIAVLALLLTASIFYIFTLKDNVHNQEYSITDLEEQKLMLQNDLDSLEIEFNSLEEVNIKQDSTLQATYLTLDQRSQEIRNLLNKSNLSAGEISSLRAQINSLKSELRSFKNKVAQLTEENEYLRASNDTLNIKNSMNRDSLSRVRGEYQQVSEEYQGAKSVITNTLAISNFEITPLKVRKNGKEVEKDRAKRVNKLEVDFSLDPNPKASSGSKTLYIAIFKPNGQLANFKNGSTGQFTDKDGRVVNYSDRINVNYSNQTGSKVEFDWDYENFSPGTYKIDVYQNGFKIGQESRSLR